MSSEVRSPRDFDLHGLGTVESIVADWEGANKGPKFERNETLLSVCGCCLVFVRKTFWLHDCFMACDCV